MDDKGKGAPSEDGRKRRGGPRRTDDSDAQVARVKRAKQG